MKQATISRSRGEHKATANTTTKIVCIHKLMHELWISHPKVAYYIGTKYLYLPFWCFMLGQTYTACSARAKTIVYDRGLLLLADLVWEKNIVLVENLRSFTTKRTGWQRLTITLWENKLGQATWYKIHQLDKSSGWWVYQTIGVLGISFSWHGCDWWTHFYNL